MCYVWVLIIKSVSNMIKNDLYREIVDNTHLEIIHQHNSVLRFCQEFGHSHENLSRVWNKKHDMSVGLFLRIMVDLKLINIDRPDKTYNLSLRKYLEVNHSEVLLGVMKLHSS